jgi:hypothetical protein
VVAGEVGLIIGAVGGASGDDLDNQGNVGSTRSDFCRRGEASIDFKSLRRIGLRSACFECIDEQCGRGCRLGGVYDF